MAIKVVPVSGNSTPTTINSNTPNAAKERAKAVYNGQDPSAVAQNQTRGTHPSNEVRSIKMKTQRTPANDQEVIDQIQTAPAQTDSNPDPSESTETTSTETKSISPQVTALLKRERAAQVKEAELKTREDALTAAQDPKTVPAPILERLKVDALGFVLDHGVSFEQLTEEVRKNMNGHGPALTRVEVELRKEIKGLKEAIENRDKVQTDSDSQATERSLDQMQKEAEQLIAEDDEYLSIRETGSVKRVRALIKRTYDETGEILSVKEACADIEADLIAQGEKFAKISKIQARIGNPAPQTAVRQTQNGNQSQMRTLTSRDTVSPAIDRRTRAIAAFKGQKPA